MESLTITDVVTKKPYHHGHVAEAMRSAARAMIDQDGPEGLGLREAARRIGVSATASYRHYQSKDDLLASVAAEGFRELSAVLNVAIRGPEFNAWNSDRVCRIRPQQSRSVPPDVRSDPARESEISEA